MSIPAFLTAGSRALHVVPTSAPVSVTMSVSKSGMTRWCWAAVAVGVAGAYGDYSETQCEVAERVIDNGHSCCPTNSACNSDQYLSDALDSHHDGFDPLRTSLAFVIYELSYGRPVPAHMKKGNIGHYVVIAAYWGLRRRYGIAPA